MSASPEFATAPAVGKAALTGTSTSHRTTPSDPDTVFTGGSQGSVVERLFVKCVNASVAATVTVFYHDGTNYFLIDELAVPALTPSGNDGIPTWGAVSKIITPERPFILPANHTIRVATNDSSATAVFHVVAMGANL